MLRKYDRTLNVYENKESRDKMPDENSTFTLNGHEFCRKKRICDDNLTVQTGFYGLFHA